MIQSEGLQMHGIVAEIKKKGIVDAFLNKEFDKFARAYNGDTTGTYAKELQQDYHFFLIKGIPDLTVRTAQLYLTYLGNFSHPVDGVLGDWTRQSLLKFQTQTILPASGLPASGQVDPPTIAELERRVFAT
jgi:peptidoglycan hydrolase-like protein with peptidoglycan-binding domain